jgi:hypothetical protein
MPLCIVDLHRITHIFFGNTMLCEACLEASDIQLSSKRGIHDGLWLEIARPTAILESCVTIATR